MILTLKEIVQEYPIKKINDNPELVHQSYYIGFFENKDNDTILAVFRQPFLMELFPEFAFKENEMPKDVPDYIGRVLNADVPIFIFDINDIGKQFYVNASLVKDFPEEYLTNEDKSYSPEIPPIYKYKYESGNFRFLGKSKPQWID